MVYKVYGIGFLVVPILTLLAAIIYGEISINSEILCYHVTGTKMASPIEKPSTRLSSKSDASDKVNCIFCGETIDKKKPAIRCDICVNWVCFTCSNLSKVLYAEISKAEESDIEWMCRVCKGTKTDLRSINDTLKDLIRSNDDRLSTVESKLTNLETNLKESVEESKKMKESVRNDLAEDIGKVRTDIAGDLSKMRSDITDEIDKRLKEKEDIAKRERNLFFYKVPESDDSESTNRIVHDRNYVFKVCEEIGIKEPKLTSVVRFGKIVRNEDKTINTSKPRPIRITFLEKRERRLVLTNAKLLKTPKDESLKSISISRDLTAVERNQYKELEKELQRRKDAGESDLYISRNRIVKKK